MVCNAFLLKPIPVNVSTTRKERLTDSELLSSGFIRQLISWLVDLLTLSIRWLTIFRFLAPSVLQQLDILIYSSSIPNVFPIFFRLSSSFSNTFSSQLFPGHLLRASRPFHAQKNHLNSSRPRFRYRPRTERRSSASFGGG